MLASLHIKNFALIESLDVTFDAGLSVVTGETGAGKSIVIGALGLLLGERAASDSVRTNADKAVIEGVFSGNASDRTAELLRSLEIDVQPELLLRRELTAKGQSRCYINDSPAPLSALKAIGDLLVDLHGQHEHQSLLRKETHAGMLDAHAGVERNLELYHASYANLSRRTRELRELRAKQSGLRERAAMLEFQTKEINAVAPQSGEDDEIQSHLKRAEHGELLFTLTAELNALLYESEHAVHDQLSQSLQKLTALSSIDPAFERWRDECSSARAAADEIASFVRRYNEELAFDPEELEKQRTRLFAITGLTKKYGGTLEAVITHRDTIAGELSAAVTFDEAVARLERDIAEEQTRCAEAARRLSDMRKRACPQLERAIVVSLKELGIATPAFEIAMTTQDAEPGELPLVINGRACAATADGIDNVEFLISTNAGEPVKPLVKVASGGEISRVMLALKTALAAGDRTPILVFDEIDVGISGRIAQKVGAAMRTLADHHQVIAITHLPQIAGYGTAHYVVEKTLAPRSATTMHRLTNDDRVKEIAKLLSGDKLTEASLRSARELIK